MLNIKTAKDAEKLTVALEGRLDTVTAPELEKRFKEALPGATELVMRKGLRQDGEDVSGDYSEYKYAWTQTVGGTEVRCFGNTEGKTERALWLSDNFSYSFLVRDLDDESALVGLDADATAALVGATE